MINLAAKFDILHSHYIEGKGVKTIARELGMSRNTVRRYVREFSDQKSAIIAGGDKSELLLAMNEKPKYDSRSRERTKVTDDILETIKGCLNENENKKAMGNGKLCMRAKDIHELLEEKGIKISYPSVANYVRILSQARKEAFIKQHYEYGDVCEFDWGEVKLTICGKQVSFRLAVFTLAASNIRYAYLYRNEDTQAFIDAHIRFFAYIGGVPKTMVYDNMRVAIAKFVGKNEKIATVALKQLSVYYGFSFRFCNICKGNEKGHVERSVEVVRRKAFSSISSFDNTAEAVTRLKSTIERLNGDKQDLLGLEKQSLLPKIPDYSSVIRVNAIVDKFSTIVYKQNHYSVPDHLVGREVEVLAFIEEIVVKSAENEVARHLRSYENHTYTLDIFHYRRTLLRKPGAVKNSLCLKQSCESLRNIYKQFFQDSPKEFIAMLELFDVYSLDRLKSAIDILVESGAKVQLDNIRMVLGNKPCCYTPPSNDEIEKACEAQLSGYAREEAVV